MFLYHFLQLCPRGHISKMLAVNRFKNTVTKRLWNFSNPFPALFECVEKNFIYQTCSFIIFFQLCPRSHISKMLAVTVFQKPRLLSAFGIFKSISCLIRIRLRKNFYLSQTCSFIIFFNFVPEAISRKCLPVTVF